MGSHYAIPTWQRDPTGIVGSQWDPSGMYTSASKSTAGGSSSKCSLRSFAGEISESMRSRASSLSRSSRSRSRECGGLVRHHSRRMTFGEPPNDPPGAPPMPNPGLYADDAPSVATKPARRPLPVLPLYSPVPPTQTSGPGPMGGPSPPGRHDYDDP